MSTALQLFWKIRIEGADPNIEGAVIYVGNHPNALIDPGLLFVATRRPVTFLAKAPLFSTPLIGWVLKGLGALPVYRKQDDPSQMGRNEGTLDAASSALRKGGAITLFPEGRSHSDPALSELKTGAARIALGAAQEGAPVRIIPVGLTYAEKDRFRSEVLIEVGEAINVMKCLSHEKEVRDLTAAIDAGLRKVTLNLARWEDLPLIKTGEALYAFRQGDAAGNAERLRLFAKGTDVFRREQPERFEKLRAEVTGFKRRLDLVRADPSDLAVVYRRAPVYRFALRNLAALLFGFPLFALGVVVFCVPFYISRTISRLLKPDLDMVSTVKFATSVFVGPLWWAGLTVAGWKLCGTAWGVVALVATPPLALFTRYFLERRREAIRDIRVFFTLGQRARLKAGLLVEGDRLAAEVEEVADELQPKL
ncbi:MAG: 1-acyl-sn-glycerol-3-phosphate acyltransferase [Myxococcaceae bacterium]